jgi:F420-dependent oxidoreductase-like protein
MHVGLHIGKFDWPGSPGNIGEKLAEIARTADDAGFYSIWVMDHLFQLGTEFGIIHGPVEAPMLEGYSTISYLAASTRRIKLGLLVTCPLYRYPGLLVKAVSTIDVLSGGRAYFGVGAGWYEREAEGLGIPFPRTWTERFERLEETLQIAKHMWRGDRSPFEGRYYRLEEPINSPQPLSKPHPPILIGGGGEKKTLRLVAEYGDAWNFVLDSPSPLEEFGVKARTHSREERSEMLRRKMGILKRHCNDVGRPYEEVEKTIVTYIKLAPGATDTAEVIELCRELDGLGFDHVIFNMPNVHEIETIEIIGREVIPEVDELA